MLLDNFFKLIAYDKTPEGLLIFRVRTVGEHPIYLGHFPEMPVTPGVCQMMLVKECLEHHFACRWQIKESRECKLLAMHTPAQDRDLEVRVEVMEQQEDSIRIVAMIKGQTSVYVKMKAVLNK